MQTCGVTQTRWCPTAQAMSGVNSCDPISTLARPSVCTGQPREPTIVRDLATLRELLYYCNARTVYCGTMKLVIPHKRPVYVGPVNRCPQPPHLRFFLLLVPCPVKRSMAVIPLTSLSQFNCVVSSQPWCPRAVQLASRAFSPFVSSLSDL